MNKTTKVLELRPAPPSLLELLFGARRPSHGWQHESRERS